MTKMDMSSSQCTSGSGCESGWTHYLDQSTTNQHYHYQRSQGTSLAITDDDLSMLSDASSGPPQHHHSFHGNASSLAQSSNIKKINDESGRTERHSCLDDTASSPVFTFPKNLSFSDKKASMEHVSSVGFSATRFKGKSAVQKHFGFFESEKPTSQDLGGRKWK